MTDSVEQKETPLSPTTQTIDPDANGDNDVDGTPSNFPYNSLRRQMSSNVNVLPHEKLLNMLNEDIQNVFNEEVATLLMSEIKEQQFDLDAIRDDMEDVEDSFLVDKMTTEFNWTKTDQQRFRNTIQNVINPQVADLTTMKSSICRKNIASELLVCGFLRNLEDDEADFEDADCESLYPQISDTQTTDGTAPRHTFTHYPSDPTPILYQHTSSVSLMGSGIPSAKSLPGLPSAKSLVGLSSKSLGGLDPIPSPNSLPDKPLPNLPVPQQDALHKKQRSIGMVIIPNEVMNLVVQYYQTITVYGIGRNSRGEFGVGHRDNFLRLKEIPWCARNTDFILSAVIPCTINGIAYVSTDGSLWVCGFNKYGQFGLSHCEEVVDIAVQHPFYLKQQLRIRDVSHGKKAYHMFVTCGNGQVYCHGANEWGQLGIGRQRDTEEYPVELDTATFDPPLDTLSQKVVISDISCGIEFSLFLTTNHKVYSCGHNKWGQLGFPNAGQFPNRCRMLLTPKLIEELHKNGREVDQIRCGDCNSYCKDREGRLLSWGRNEFGELGTGERSCRLRWRPKVIPFFEEQNIKILKICSGSDHVLVLDESGRVYSWGFGKYGCCGDGDIKHQFVPRMMRSLERFNIVDIRYCHSP